MMGGGEMYGGRRKELSKRRGEKSIWLYEEYKTQYENINKLINIVF